MNAVLIFVIKEYGIVHVIHRCLHTLGNRLNYFIV